MTKKSGFKQRFPFDFIVEQLESQSPIMRPFFGGTAVYVGEKIMLVLRDMPARPESNGVWVATTREHHESLRTEIRNLVSIGLPRIEATGWQLLPMSSPHFEEDAFKVCEMILRGDVRIGKLPKQRIDSTRQMQKKDDPQSGKRRVAEVERSRS